MKQIRSTQASNTPLTLAYHDYVIFEAIDQNERFEFIGDELEDLAQQLYDLYEEGKCKYIQFVKEWEECTGFATEPITPSSSPTTSILLDIDDTIKALQQDIEIDVFENDTLVLKKDVIMFKNFLQKHRNQQIKIYAVRG